MLEWVAYPFSSRSSQHRNQTGVSCIAGGFFTNWAFWEALESAGGRHGVRWRWLKKTQTFGSYVKMKVTQLRPTLWDATDYTVHGILQARILEWVAFPFSRESSQPRIKPRSPALQVDFLPAESQGKPKNTGVDSLSLLRQIFPTQKLNGGLLHCRWILYQLSYFYPLSFFTYKMKIRGPDSIGFWWDWDGIHM